jgi:uncharacterized protein YcgI (DUF1989 family)
VEGTPPGRHDCIAAACDKVRDEQLGAGLDHGSCEENDSCEENLQAETRRHNFEVMLALSRSNIFANSQVSPNIFANSQVSPEGALLLNECVSKRGDAATFKVLMDSMVVLFVFSAKTAFTSSQAGRRTWQWRFLIRCHTGEWGHQ